ncbi:hypothetical protein [Paenibacillus tuaregi]|nr:hypothetical protein [Paenibacillus tuaregi]
MEREIMGERGSMVEREINREKVRVEYGREMKKNRRPWASGNR